MTERAKTVGDLIDRYDKMTELVEHLDWLIGTIRFRGDLSAACHDRSQSLKESLLLQMTDTADWIIAALQPLDVSKQTGPITLVHNGRLYEISRDDDGRPGSRPLFQSKPSATGNPTILPAPAIWSADHFAGAGKMIPIKVTRLMHDPIYLNAAGLARLTGLPETWIQEQTALGRMPSFETPDGHRYHAEQTVEFLSNRFEIEVNVAWDQIGKDLDELAELDACEANPTD